MPRSRRTPRVERWTGSGWIRCGACHSGVAVVDRLDADGRIQERRATCIRRCEPTHIYRWGPDGKIHVSIEPQREMELAHA